MVNLPWYVKTKRPYDPRNNGVLDRVTCRKLKGRSPRRDTLVMSVLGMYLAWSIRKYYGVDGHSTRSELRRAQPASWDRINRVAEDFTQGRIFYRILVIWVQDVPFSCGIRYPVSVGARHALPLAYHFIAYCARVIRRPTWRQNMTRWYLLFKTSFRINGAVSQRRAQEVYIYSLKLATSGPWCSRYSDGRGIFSP